MRWARAVPARRLFALFAILGVIAAACTSQTGSDTTPTVSADGRSSVTAAGCAVPIPGGPQPWPFNDRRPDAGVAPNGVDTKPLEDPPTRRPPDSDCAPIDPKKGIDNINHLVFIVMENRSFDHYFGTYPGADGIPMNNGEPTVCQPTAKGGCAYPYHDTNFIDQAGPHGHKASVMSYNGGKMDGFIRALDTYGNGCRLHPDVPPCPEATDGPAGQPDVMGYHTAEELPNYWKYAKQYTLFDRMFAPVDSWTLPSHLYMISGWSAWCPDLNDPMSCRPELVFHPASQFNDQWEGVTWRADMANEYPRPYVWAPITWLLYQQGVSWGYFVGAGSCVTPPCGGLNGPKTADIQNPLPGFVATEATAQFANIRSNEDFLKMAAHGNLPSVSWVVPVKDAGDHPPDDISLGQAYVTNLINAVTDGPKEQWNHTAIFVTWDDWGGFYDHVKPPQSIDGVPNDNYGFRVPTFMVSPWAKRGIDSQTMSFDAFLRLIEDRFLGGDRLDPKTDGWPDSRPSIRETAPELHPLDGAFDFTGEPRAPLVLDPMPSQSSG
jgi:phospholipase C